MSAEEINKNIIRQLLEATDKGQFHLIGKFYHSDFVEHNSHAVVKIDSGAHGVRKAFELLHEAFPDRLHVIEDMIAEGDKVAARVTFIARFTGQLGNIPPNNQEYRVSGTSIYRFKDNQIIEKWTHVSVLKELGISLDDLQTKS